MDYCHSITVPKNTFKENSLVSQIILPYGSISEIGYQFPSGCAGLAHLTIWIGGVQMFPRSPNLSYYGDDLFRNFTDNLKLPEAFNVITFKCWNDDDTWPHTITVHITLLSDDTPGWFKQLFWGLTGQSGGS